jgi:hypothetical protein
MQCSLAAYKEPNCPQVDGVKFTEHEYKSPPEICTAKTSFSAVAHHETWPDSVYVFSIRGSASAWDHMVNLNGDTGNVEGFIVWSTSMITELDLVLTGL